MLVPNSILQNRYLIVSELGHGGMGTVYKAIDQRVSCVVALKQTLVGANTPAREAFQREAALLANLRHASLPKVMDYFSEGDGEFLVMEYIAGHDLADLLEQQQAAFPQDQVLVWADELLKLLDYLHTREPPIVHRDIKPANLKITDEGEIFLLDFGLAKGAAGQMATVRTDGSVHGYTPLYAPLEQIHGQGTDPRTDIYSLGATLYDLLTGQPPVAAPVRYEAIENERPDPLPPANRLNSRVPFVIAEVIQNAMALSRRNRFSSAAEMRNALERAKQTVADLEAARKAAGKALDKKRSDPRTDPDKPLVTDSNVEFTVYSPRQIKPEKNYTMLAFAHLAKKRDDAPADEPDPIEEMKDQAARILGKQHADYDDVKESGSQPVPREGEITFVPIVPGITFSPASRTFTWRKSVHREEFDLWVTSDLDGKNLSGQMTVFLGNLVFAEVPLKISVNSRAESAAEKVSLDGPQSSRRLRQIFASYSDQDEQIVAELAQVAPLFGSRFVLDRTHLEPGEDRREGLQRLIRGADMFQLFWSTNAMRSADTVDEINYAVSLKRPGFILPTYWEEPLPRSPVDELPPPAIERLQFHRIYPGAISQAAFGGKSSEHIGAADAGPEPSVSFRRFDEAADVAMTGELAPLQSSGTDTPVTPHAPVMPPGYDRRTPTLSGTRTPEIPAMRPSATASDLGAGTPAVAVVFCVVCGIKLAADIRFCPHCGTDSRRPVDSETSAPKVAHESVRAITQPLSPPKPSPTVFSQPLETTALPPTPAQGAFSPPPQMPTASAKRKFPMMPIYAGAAMLLLVMILAPAWFIMSSNRTGSVANSNKSFNSNPTSTSAPPKSFTNSVGMEFVYVASGTFMMGSNDDKPAHQVAITKPFYLAKYEVTQAQWQAVMGNNPSHYKGNKSPVEQVSWNDAIAFIAKLNSRNDGFTYRLPTEAEWEYAARAGTTSTYYWGNDQTEACRYANVGDQTAKEKYPDARLIECRDGYSDSSPVGSFQPNNFGLYDMIGNVSEWCQDWYDANYYGASPGSDPQGPASGQARVLRGGTFGQATWMLGSATRFESSPDAVASNFGFRVAAVRIQ